MSYASFRRAGVSLLQRSCFLRLSAAATMLLMVTALPQAVFADCAEIETSTPFTCTYSDYTGTVLDMPGDTSSIFLSDTTGIQRINLSGTHETGIMVTSESMHVHFAEGTKGTIRFVLNTSIPSTGITFDFQDVTSTPIKINLAKNTAQTVYPGLKLIIESLNAPSEFWYYAVTGTNGDDVITGSISADTLRGNGGNDILRGGNGQNTLIGGPGNDIIIGGIDDDRMEDNEGENMLDGRAGDDTVRSRGGTNTIYLRDGRDQVLAAGRTSSYVIYGGPGDDEIDLLETVLNNTISGGPGNDFVIGGFGDDLLKGDTGDDTVFGNEGNDSVFGGSGSDRVSGSNGIDTVNGGAGVDTRVITREDECVSNAVVINVEQDECAG